MSDLQTLIARVEAASGPDREIDSKIALELLGGAATYKGDVLWNINADGWDALPAYTASLDAAVRLVEAKLPGYEWFVNSSGFAGVRSDAHDNGANGNHEASPALALVAALLHALEAIAQGGEKP